MYTHQQEISRTRIKLTIEKIIAYGNNIKSHERLTTHERLTSETWITLVKDLNVLYEDDKRPTSAGQTALVTRHAALTVTM